MPDKIASPSVQRLPGRGLMGWIGRQFGYVTKAVKHDPGGPQTVFRTKTIKEQPLPENPEVTLRRTTIDEVIVNKNSNDEIRNSNQ